MIANINQRASSGAMSQQDFDSAYRSYERYMSAIRNNEEEEEKQNQIIERSYELALKDFEERMKKGRIYG